MYRFLSIGKTYRPACQIDYWLMSVNVGINRSFVIYISTSYQSAKIIRHISLYIWATGFVDWCQCKRTSCVSNIVCRHQYVLTQIGDPIKSFRQAFPGVRARTWPDLPKFLIEWNLFIRNYNNRRWRSNLFFSIYGFIVFLCYCVATFEWKII